ncbi:MAG: PucR family transcriptional regulator, partial [Thermus sp.]
ADRLGVHPNTVLYRLHRVEELTGLNLSSTHDRLLLYMAIFLLRFQKAHEGPKASP